MSYYSSKREIKLKTKDRDIDKRILFLTGIIIFIASIFLGKWIGFQLLGSRTGIKSPAAIDDLGPLPPRATQFPSSPSGVQPQRQNISSPPLVIPPPVVEPGTSPAVKSTSSTEDNNASAMASKPSTTSSPANKPPESNKAFKVQTGLFSNVENAKELSNLLQQQGYKAEYKLISRSEGSYYQVWVGPYDNRQEAESAASALNGKGYQAFIIQEPNQ